MKVRETSVRFTVFGLGIAALATLASVAMAGVASASVPLAPEAVRKERINTEQVLITWRDASSNEDGFRIYRRIQTESELELRGEVLAGATEFLDETPKGDIYIYHVVSFNEDGESDLSNQCYVNRNPAKVPLYFNVRLIALTVMRVRWSDTEAGERGFEIQRKEPGKAFKTIARVPANTEVYDDYTLSAATDYIYRMRTTGKTNQCWANSKWTPERYDETLGGKRLLRIDLRGQGKGKVTSNPEGISCGPHDDHCEAWFPLATDVTITADPADNSKFAGWADIYKCEGVKTPCTFNMGKNRDIGAIFRLK